MKFRFTVVPLLALALWAGSSRSRTELVSLPSGFVLDTVLSGAAVPVALAFAPDGRLFYSELDNGRIRVIEGDSLLSTPFAQLPVDPAGEKGLLGITLDPFYPDSPYVYVFYTDLNLGHNRVVRFLDSLNTGTDLRAVIDSIPAGFGHNGGNLRFGPDEMLYITVGDNTFSANSNDTTSLAGKILRFDRNGSIPDDNPFPGYAAYCLGLRNSFDFIFHPHNGKLYATENGPEDFDEINIIEPAVHYGWPAQKGPGGEPIFRDPIHYYVSTIGPTGITVCRNGSWPAEYFNDLFYVDYNESRIRRMVLKGFDLTEVDTVYESWLTDPGFSTGFLDIEFSPDQDLYFSDVAHIYRLRYEGSATETIPGAIPSSFVLHPNVPNPFNPSTRIGYSISGPLMRVRLAVFDLEGRLLKILFEGNAGTGNYEWRWDGKDSKGRTVASGVYMVRLEYGDDSLGRRIVHIK